MILRILTIPLVFLPLCQYTPCVSPMSHVQKESRMPQKNARTLGEPLVLVSVRLPESLITRVDQYVDVMRQTLPGASVGRADALRSLVVQALDALAPPQPPTKRKRQATPAD